MWCYVYKDGIEEGSRDKVREKPSTLIPLSILSKNILHKTKPSQAFQKKSFWTRHNCSSWFETRSWLYDKWPYCCQRSKYSENLLCSTASKERKMDCPFAKNRKYTYLNSDFKNSQFRISMFTFLVYSATAPSLFIPLARQHFKFNSWADTPAARITRYACVRKQKYLKNSLTVPTPMRKHGTKKN